MELLQHMKDKISGSQKLLFVFPTEGHQVSFHSMRTAMGMIEALVKESRKDCKIAKNKKIRLEVTAPQQGSVQFGIDINLFDTSVVQMAKELFTKENIEIVGSMIGIVTGVIEIKRHLKGKKPDQVIKDKDSVTIIYNDNSITVDYSVFQAYTDNPAYEDHMSNAYKDFSKEDDFPGFYISKLNEDEKAEGIIHMTPEDVSECANVGEMFEDDIKTVEKKKVIITIDRLSFSETKWKAYYEGNHISIDIDDNNFFENIADYTFQQGSRMEVDMVIKQVRNKLDAFENRGYSISCVHRILPRDRQKGLFD